MRRMGILVALAACYRAPTPGQACAITCDDACPGDLTCQGGYCVEPGQVCHPGFSALAAGAGFACAIEDGTGALWCWGSNTHHQLDPGDRLQFPLATRIDERVWQAIDAGGEHACGITNGQLLCWGRNDHGQAGQPGPDDVTAPTQVAGAPVAQWTAVSAGAEHSCAIGSGTLYCWGRNASSVLGNGDFNDVDFPLTPVMTDLGDWTAVSAGERHTCAISTSGGAFCWGDGSSGQLGPAATSQQATPVLALAPPVTSVAAAGRSTCATDGGGGLLCWGDNSNGELGELNVALPSTSTPMPASAVKGWSAVTADETSLCGLAFGDVYCWGAESLGGLGNGVWSESKKFGKVLGGASAVAVGMHGATAGLDLGCALLVGGDVACWGDNRFGQLGRGAATMAVEPGELAGGHALAQLAIGVEHGCGVEGSTLVCWGSTEAGQTTGTLLGSANPRAPCTAGLDCDVGAPKEIAFAAGATKVAAGLGHTCALHNDLITCWGLNNAGELGTGGAGPVRRDVPLANGRPWVDIYPTGNEGQCASPGGGETWCWGAVIGGTAPAVQPALANVRAIAIGPSLACALDATGQLECTGDNSVGQYGNGDPGFCGDGACNNNETAGDCSSDCVSPLAMLARTYTALAVGRTGEFACGVTPGATVECWGANERGQTSAAENPTKTPVAVPGLAACTAVAAGAAHACAICSGRLACWGDNQLGQLGRGGVDGAPGAAAPIDLAIDGDPWVELGAGASFTCARSGNGRVFCWGSDPHAGLGNGATSANLPVTVLASPIE
jgi:alpha-tubulin suppressor-like RCC1 family protein